MNYILKLILYVATVSFFVPIFANVDDLDVRSGKSKSKADHSYKTEKDEAKKKSKKSDKNSSKKESSHHSKDTKNKQ